MHTVFVNAIQDNGEVCVVWDKHYASLLDAQTKGVQEAKEFIECDAGHFTVKLYQLCIPCSDGRFSRFFVTNHSIMEVLF